MQLTSFIAIAKIASYVLAGVASISLIVLRILKILSVKQTRLLIKQINVEKFSAQYTATEVADAVNGYIRPDCSVTDPSNEVDLVSYADIRENIFDVIDKSIINSSQRRHQLILADSGMGKTSFCLNYFWHFKRKSPDENIALISLASGDAIHRISFIARKSSTVLILDALDEDPVAIANGPERLYELLQASSDFRCVIVTCRSQFFSNDAAIPTETGVSVVTPRRAGQNVSYKLFRLYLAPFNEQQIKAYIHSHFPFWSFFSYVRRKKAFSLVSNIRELAARPMLLELLPMLVNEKRDSQEIYDLYEFMVDKWLDRESYWITQNNLLEISKKLAVMVHRQQSAGRGDRITVSQLNSEAANVSVEPEAWKHLTTRSLLNRDSEGKFKFAHRSIMEFLFVVAALERMEGCFEVRWTDLMRELFISWGYTKSGIEKVARAREILRMDLGETGLLPLSETPARPAFVGSPDFERAASRRDTGRGVRRSANALWRKDSVRVKSLGALVTVTDLEYNLYWEILGTNSDTDGASGYASKQTVAQAQHFINAKSAFRLPSYAEFVTLLECLAAVNRSELIPDGELYLLGDNLGDRRHLVVTVGVGRDWSKSTIIVDRDRLASFTSRKITAYEMGIFVHPASLHSLKVVLLRVRSAFD